MMKRTIGIKKSGQIGKGEFILAPQNGMGVLLAHMVTGKEQVDGGKYVEIATSDGRKHLVGKEDQIVVVSKEP